MANEFAAKHCVPCEGGAAAMSTETAEKHLDSLHERWGIAEDGKSIAAQFDFKGFCRTSAFINAVIWIAANEGHHPDVSFGYNSAVVSFGTHDVDGLTENDFICAARVDALFD